MRKGKFISFILSLAAAFPLAIMLHATAPQTFGQQNKTAGPEDLLRGATTGSTRIVDMTYAINGKLPA